jgi:hypothetical protein
MPVFVLRISIFTKFFSSVRSRHGTFLFVAMERAVRHNAGHGRHGGR